MRRPAFFFNFIDRPAALIIGRRFKKRAAEPGTDGQTDGRKDRQIGGERERERKRETERERERKESQRGGVVVSIKPTLVPLGRRRSIDADAFHRQVPLEDGRPGRDSKRIR